MGDREGRWQQGGGDGKGGNEEVETWRGNREGEIGRGTTGRGDGVGQWEGRGAKGRGRRRGKTGDFTDGYDGMPLWT